MEDMSDQVSCKAECCPLKTWEAVCAWEPAGHEACVATVQLPDGPSERPARPRVLVCHDMAGGYLQDRFAQGSPDGQAYHFYHWRHVDTFIYFSHYFVTIPPPGWMNAAHRHGTKVLGTVITEWDDGKQRCKRFLESDDSVTQFVDKLVAIAQYYHFEGWLINIENPIEEPEAVGRLLHFVQLLTEKTHAANPQGEVIWYDSVTCEGKLKWQDELNDLNCCYFDVCDGIFLNYTWKDEGLARSAELARSKGRLHDVCVGVDVFGRNCRGGGGFNTIEALQAISVQSLSMAIFAQGWVYEKLGKESFPENENKYWRLIRQHLPLRGINHLPLVSNFCRGQGQNYTLQGQVLSEAPWTHLSLQSTQPTLAAPAPEAPLQLRQHTQAAFCGGSSLRLSGVVPEQGQTPHYKLFNLSLPISCPLILSCSYKSLDGHSHPAIVLSLTTESGSQELTCSCEEIMEEETSDGNQPHLTQMSDDKKTEMFQHYDISLQEAWKTRVFELNLPESYHGTANYLGLNLIPPADSRSFDVLLGQLSVFTNKDVEEVPRASELTVDEVKWLPGKVDMLLSCHLKWQATGPPPSHYIVYYKLPVAGGEEPAAKRNKPESEWEYHGVSHVPEYWVTGWSLPRRETTSVSFKIRPVSILNLPVAMDDLPICSLSVDSR